MSDAVRRFKLISDWVIELIGSPSDETSDGLFYFGSYHGVRWRRVMRKSGMQEERIRFARVRFVKMEFFLPKVQPLKNLIMTCVSKSTLSNSFRLKIRIPSFKTLYCISRGNTFITLRSSRSLWSLLIRVKVNSSSVLMKFFIVVGFRQTATSMSLWGVCAPIATEP